jgi:hypothetical protein
MGFETTNFNSSTTETPKKHKKNPQGRIWKQIFYKKIIFKPKLLSMGNPNKPTEPLLTDPIT